MLAIFALLVACKDPVSGISGGDESFTVTFDKNGGDTEASPQTKTVTLPATTIDALPTAPTRTSYNFTGWNTAANGSGTAFTATTPVTADITVYAQWQNVPAGSFTVTFDKNGGDTEANPATKTVTSPATTVGTLPTQPTRANYTFASWNTAANGSGTEFTATTPVTASITVYAQWTAVTPGSFTITFDKNGGDTEASPQTKTVTPPATTIDALPTAPTRTGYTFASWNTAANGSGGTEFTATTPVTASITVYAQWTADTYTVTFNKNHSDTTGFTEADPATKTVTSPATIVGTLPTAPTRTGYDFVKWNILANGNGSEFTATTPVTASISVYAEWERLYTIEFEITGSVTGDSVTASPESAKAGVAITISYTLANDKINNRLVFSGTETSIGEVDEAGTGTKTYTVDAEDADLDGTITIIATFTHTDKTPDTIALTESVVNDKKYGDAPFTITVSNSGTGTGAITYSSSHTDIATVNASTGEVTILKVGTATITATKAADATYEGTTANYALHVQQLQLIIGAPTGGTTTKPYDGNTTATGFVAGSLTNKVGTDDVTVAVASAVYNSANVADANKITVTYTISGTAAANYTAPAPSDITTGVSITKATGAVVTAPTLASKTNDSVTINAVAAPNNGQTVEYNYNTGSTEPSSLWGAALTFSSLSPATEYYFFARAAANDNYEAGTANSVAITTDAAPTKDPGATLSGSVTVYRLRHDSVRINIVTITPANGQTVEYSVSLTSAGEPGAWQDSPIAAGLSPETAYTAYARAKENDNNAAGTPISGTFTTKAAPTPPYNNTPPSIVNFEDKAIADTYNRVTGQGSSSAAVIVDPADALEKSLQITSSNWNNGAIIPINLPFALENYQSFTFRYWLNGVIPTNNRGNGFWVYVMSTTAGLPNNELGNANAVYTARLLKNIVPDYDAVSQWVDFEMPIDNQIASFNTIKDLQGDIFLVIGINSGNSITYMLDDLTFNLKPHLNSSITPTTATFIKADAVDIAVNMTLNGNTLTKITSEDGDLEEGEDADYTVENGVVTLLSSYLAGQDEGPLTLTFDFNNGDDPVIVITIMASRPATVTSYNFSTDPGAKGGSWDVFPSNAMTVTWLNSVGGTANANQPSAGVMNLAVTSGGGGSASFVLKFTLGTNETLADYKGIRVQFAPLDNNSQYKQFTAEVSPTGTFDRIGASGQVRLVTPTSNSIGGAGAWTTTDFNFNTAADRSGYSGDVKIAIGTSDYLGSGAIQIKLVELYK